jgi:hypothetical protein
MARLVEPFQPQRARRDRADLFRAACDMSLEGLVSKGRDRPYQAGRSKNWIKVKTGGIRPWGGSSLFCSSGRASISSPSASIDHTEQAKLSASLWYRQKAQELSRLLILKRQCRGLWRSPTRPRLCRTVA